MIVTICICSHISMESLFRRIKSISGYDAFVVNSFLVSTNLMKKKLIHLEYLPFFLIIDIIENNYIMI